MSLRSTPTRYGTVAILIHWTSALAIVLAWTCGFILANALPAGEGAPLLIAHIVLGLCVFALTLLRMLWWLALDRRPQEAAGDAAWQMWLARIVQLGFYVILLLMVADGIATLLLSGAIPVLLAGGPVPDFSALLPRVAHGIMSRVLLGLLVLHIAGALYHQFVRRDHLLQRMGVGA